MTATTTGRNDYVGILVDDVEKFSKEVGALGGRHHMDQAATASAASRSSSTVPKGCSSTLPNTRGLLPNRSPPIRSKPPNKPRPYRVGE
jgi:hypothetical protein